MNQKNILKFLLLVGFLFPSNIKGQSYNCTFKMDDLSKWIPCNTNIVIDKDEIRVYELEGVELIIKYDEIKELQGSLFYSYKNHARVSIPISFRGNRIITVFRNNYICPQDQ